ncbi:hypothetical protein KOW79_006033 [Hemibagrus wyckioides]|uniref:ACB domain-containing protein n=1 Tax=Hemibagrus wyckioides TaxID=337641 RepID=A0A9D3SM46_9TELE|nr:hypothetical protein KOW79_006033 [Hemibagrus wyckioides]
MEDRSVHQRRFEAAVKVMRTLPADGVFVPSEDMLIRFKTYHRQATVGVCKSSEACGRDTLSKAEWEAWKALGDMSKEEAMKAYVEEILLILEMIPVTEEVSNLLDVLEPFYEVVEDEDKEEGDVNVLRCHLQSRGIHKNETFNILIMFFFSFCLFCETGSSDEYRGSSAGDVDDDVEEDDDDDAEDGGDVSEQSCDESVSEVCTPAKRPQGRGGNTKEEGVSQDGNPQGAALPPLHTAAHGPLRSVILSAGRGRGESATCLSDVATVLNGGKAGQGMVTGQLNTQIVVALSRLQDDMRSVLASLSTLETRALSQVERLALRSAPHTPQHLRKCPWTVSPISVAFLLLWPFVAHYLAWLYLQKKRKTRL